MAKDEPPRSRAARRAAESALVRVVHHYGTTPEFVLLGGLVPELLCSGSEMRHAGTTDVDVQVNLEIAAVLPTWRGSNGPLGTPSSRQTRTVFGAGKRKWTATTPWSSSSCSSTSTTREKGQWSASTSVSGSAP